MTCGEYTDWQHVCGDTMTSGHGNDNTDARKFDTTDSSCKTWCASQGGGCCEFREGGTCLYKKNGVSRFFAPYTNAKVVICTARNGNFQIQYLALLNCTFSNYGSIVAKKFGFCPESSKSIVSHQSTFRYLYEKIRRVYQK